MKRFVSISVLLLLFVSMSFAVQDEPDAKMIIKKADANVQGEKSSYMEMTMTIVRPKWERSVGFKTWTKEADYSMTYITNPAKEKGQVFMKRLNEMWVFDPKLNRDIKMPPSMMSQGWMGSDFTNDDMLKESSIVKDYTHKIIGNEVVNGEDCYKVELMAIEDAEIVWGKQIRWVTKDKYLMVKVQYFDEDEELVRTEIASNIKEMSGRIVPTKFELIPADKPGNKTIVEMTKIEYNIKVEDSFFSKQSMKRVR